METLLLQITEMGLGGWAINLLVVAALSLLASNFLSGIYVKNFGAAIILAVVLALLNATLGWVLRGLAMPVNWITFGLLSGLISLAISTVIVYIADRLLNGFEAKNLFWTFIFALTLAIGTTIMGWIGLG